MDAEETVEKAERLVARAQAEYADFRLESASFTKVVSKDGEVEAERGEWAGFCFRVLAKGAWGFACANDEVLLGKTLEKAARLAKAGEGNSRVSREKIVRAEARARFRKNPEDFSIEEKVNCTKELEKRVRIAGIKNSSASYSDAVCTRIILNSAGSMVREANCRTYIFLNAIAGSGEKMGAGSERVGIRGGFEAVDEALEKAGNASRKALQALKAPRAKAGDYMVIADGEMAGVMAHEAVGHACEADALIAHDSVLEGKKGEKIAGPQVTIVDDATAGAFGGYAFDDEGVKAQRKVLIEKGVLKGFLHSLDSAGFFGEESTGNGRAMDYASPPIVRMSNTFFEKGKWKKDELFDVPKALYVKGMRGGQVIPKNGSYVFTAEEGFMVERGEVKSPVRDILLTGDILETLKSVDAVADDFSDSPGTCGKAGQGVPVSDGGPHIRIKGMRVGGV